MGIERGPGWLEPSSVELVADQCLDCLFGQSIWLKDEACGSSLKYTVDWFSLSSVGQHINMFA